MMACARMFSCLSIPSSLMREQSNPGGTRGSVDVMVTLDCCACAEKAPKPSSARKTPARTINRPIKMRRLKKADCEDFFFMDGVWAEGLVFYFSSLFRPLL